MKLNKNKIYPWRAKNSFELLINAIDNAKNFILLETYFVESGKISSQFITAVIAAVNRGVKVYVLFDDMGTRSLNESDRNLLVNNGVNLCFYHPIKFFAFLNNFYRDHRKLLLVDGSIAFIGGAGLSDQFIGDNYWRDNMITIQGGVLQDWYALFLQNWQKQSEKPLPIQLPNEIINKQFNALGRLSYTHGYFFNQIKIHLHQKIKTSKSKVWLVSAYFIPSLKLRRLLS